MTQDPIASIAGKLTKAQREAIPLLPVSLTQWLPIGVSVVTRRNLIALGILDSVSPASGFGMMQWTLSPLGVEVRSYLERQKP